MGSRHLLCVRVHLDMYSNGFIDRSKQCLKMKKCSIIVSQWVCANNYLKDMSTKDIGSLWIDSILALNYGGN